jgi:hypothetical protein
MWGIGLCWAIHCLASNRASAADLLETTRLFRTGDYAACVDCERKQELEKRIRDVGGITAVGPDAHRSANGDRIRCSHNGDRAHRGDQDEHH